MRSVNGQCLAALDVIVDREGAVRQVRCLYGSLPLTDDLTEVVKGWSFRPALVRGEPQPSHVLVAGLVRPPTLREVGPCGPPDQVRRAPPSLPVPVVPKAPVYPARADGGATVVVEVEIAREGEVSSARIVGEPTPFDTTAKQAARAWRFHFEQKPAPSRAYLVFGFLDPARSPGPG
jgi:TonB family protein